MKGGEEVIEETIGADGSEGEDQGGHQVVGDTAGETGKPGKHGGHHIPEIIIRNGITGKPRVVRREGRRAQDGVDEHQLHGALGAIQFGVTGAQKGKEGKGEEE